MRFIVTLLFLFILTALIFSMQGCFIASKADYVNSDTGGYWKRIPKTFNGPDVWESNDYVCFSLYTNSVSCLERKK